MQSLGQHNKSFSSPISNPRLVWVGKILKTILCRGQGHLPCPGLGSTGFPPTGTQVNSDGRKPPWVTADEVWFGYYGKSPHGKGCQTLEQAAWGTDGVPSGTWGHRWLVGLAVLWGMVDWMSLEGFPNLKDSMVLMTLPNPLPHCCRMCLQDARAHPSSARKEISLLAPTLEHFEWGEGPPDSNSPCPGLNFVLCLQPVPPVGTALIYGNNCV